MLDPEEGAQQDHSHGGGDHSCRRCPPNRGSLDQGQDDEHGTGCPAGRARDVEISRPWAGRPPTGQDDESGEHDGGEHGHVHEEHPAPPQGGGEDATQESAERQSARARRSPDGDGPVP